MVGFYPVKAEKLWKSEILTVYDFVVLQINLQRMSSLVERVKISNYVL